MKPTDNPIEYAKTHMKKAADHLKDDLKSIRTGRANPGMLDHVFVEVYGSNMRLSDVATVSVPEPRQLLISPFDGSNAGAIKNGIIKANLNLQPIQDGNIVRINVPPMDEAMRKSIAKECKKKGEDAKVGIRNIRRDANEGAKKQKDGGIIAEDQLKRAEKEIQTLTDKFCKEIDDICAAKEKEVMTV